MTCHRCRNTIRLLGIILLLALVVVLFISIVCLFIRLITVGVNRLIFAIAGALNDGFGAFLIIALIGAWVIGSIVGGVNLFNWFAKFPELTDWFTHGNWIGCILFIVGVWGLIARLKVNND